MSIIPQGLSNFIELLIFEERLAKYHGSQCGFCTPGMVMSMYALLRNKKSPTRYEINSCLQGNLCRCTGYRPIVEAFETFACCEENQCCRNDETKCSQQVDGKNPTLEYLPCDSSQEIIFPAELLLRAKVHSSSLTYKFIGERVTWFQPTCLSEVINLKSEFPGARIVVGNTEIGIETTIKGNFYPYIIHPICVSEMNVLLLETDGVRIGSSCTLEEVNNFIFWVMTKENPVKTQMLSAIVKILDLFGGLQIRNVASLGGNIMTASPISDLNPIFVAGGVLLKFESIQCGTREVFMDENFFTGYRKTIAKPDEVLVDIKIPFTSENEVMTVFKQSKRKHDDIAIVNAAMKVIFQAETSKVEKFSAAYGGMAPVIKAPLKAMKHMIGRQWNEELLKDTLQWLSEDMRLDMGSPGGMVEYRQTLATSFFFKFYNYVLSELSKRGIQNSSAIQLDVLSDIDAEKKTVHGTQTWEKLSDDQSIHDTIGHPIPHLSIRKHVTGESEYVDDMLRFQDELHMALVYSSRAHAEILNVNITDALACKGYVAYYSRKVVTGKNEILGEEIFADGKVTCIGHVIGAVVADTPTHALNASRLVKVDYKDISPKIITTEEAIEHNSYYGSRVKMKKGQVENIFQDCDNVIEAEMRIGGQEHFYLETQSCIVVPKDKAEEIEIWSSCQTPSTLQTMVALGLGLLCFGPRNKVISKVKRIGGAFGGKEFKVFKIAAPAAIAAKKLERPIRCVLSRQDDMQITGGRHPFLVKYKVGFNNDGQVISLQEHFYLNGGNTVDLSRDVATTACIHADSCYNIKNMEIYGYACKTNIASNTAMRGFGSPQATLIAEDWITRISHHLEKSAEEIRKLNLYRDGHTTHFAHTFKDSHFKRCWREVMQRSNFEASKRKIEEFN